MPSDNRDSKQTGKLPKNSSSHTVALTNTHLTLFTHTYTRLSHSVVCQEFLPSVEFLPRCWAVVRCGARTEGERGAEPLIPASIPTSDSWKCSPAAHYHTKLLLRLSAVTRLSPGQRQLPFTRRLWECADWEKCMKTQEVEEECQLGDCVVVFFFSLATRQLIQFHRYHEATWTLKS